MFVSSRKRQYKSSLDERQHRLGDLLCRSVGSDVTLFLAGREQRRDLGGPRFDVEAQLFAEHLGRSRDLRREFTCQASALVIDLLQTRLDKAMKVGADAVINSAREDVVARLIELHGPGESIWPGKSGTNIYLDAAGVSEVVTTALTAALRGATLGIVGVHKEPVSVDFMNVMSNELTIVGSMGYPDEIFEVTKDIIEHWEKYAVIVSHTFAFDDLDEALRCAATPGASDKIVITFD